MTLTQLKVVLAENGSIAALIVLVGFFSLSSDRFLRGPNLETVVGSMVEIGLVAIPLSLLVMSGSVDLSVGSVASLSAIVSAQVMTDTGRVIDGVVVGLLVGVVCGVINGILVEYFQLNALVVTLGFLNVWGGMALYLSEGKTITGLPTQARTVAQFSILGLHLPIVLLIVASVAAWWLLNRRPFGRQTLAVGGNERAAHLMGINVRTVRLRLFVLSSVGAAMAGVLLMMKLGAASPNVGLGMEFSALTVVLLGGVAFDGGSGRISGVLAGLLFVGVLRNGLVLLGVSQFLQTVFVGLTLILAISLDKSLQRVLKSAWADMAKKRQSALAASEVAA
ncbi:monosaccharide ABC transporter membrane protein (CUT2 family) [Ilumatobacter fluminis]|uniref:Monosaccharide ABC transporter membrane protein (CUT2 family) n=1 Tax=Ilumatobacter fluminis TaxID=467091 RepID=A0A4R7HXF5_9ACTN|nr:ABC transporter permease [Ilumatobacter fluminis]TDT15872.1 monosaccharide ABC transporter membrane protein (CUT2 family) [Ilumatobacter fluminis]